MKSTLIVVILALACGYGLYSQNATQEKRIADAKSRAANAAAEAERLRPDYDKAKARYESRKADYDDTAATLPEKVYAEVEKAEAAKLAEAKAALAEETAKTVPDPQLPADAVAEIEACNKELASIAAQLKPVEDQNVVMRKYKVAEIAAMPKSKAEKVK